MFRNNPIKFSDPATDSTSGPSWRIVATGSGRWSSWGPSSRSRRWWAPRLPSSSGRGSLGRDRGNGDRHHGCRGRRRGRRSGRHRGRGRENGRGRGAAAEGRRAGTRRNFGRCVRRGDGRPRGVCDDGAGGAGGRDGEQGDRAHSRCSHGRAHRKRSVEGRCDGGARARRAPGGRRRRHLDAGSRTIPRHRRESRRDRGTARAANAGAFATRTAAFSARASDFLEAYQLSRNVAFGFNATGRTLTTTETGALGELRAARELRNTGYTNIRSVQNASGHGIDLIGERNGVTEYFEVKTSTTARAPELSKAQSQINSFIRSRLTRAATGARGWGRISPAVRADARALLLDIQGGASLSGEVIRITNLRQANQLLTRTTW